MQTQPDAPGGSIPHGRPLAAAAPASLAAILLVTLLTRLAYIPAGIVGKDGPLYINSLNFDRTFNVPPPGNIGYVALGKVGAWLGLDPILAFGLVGTLFSCMGAAYVLLLARLWFPPVLAFATACAVALNSMVWYHGPVLMSYIVWFAFLPAIAYHGIRFLKQRQGSQLAAAVALTGVSTIVRPDMVLFAGPLLGGILLLGRATLWQWLAAAAFCAVCCMVWFLGTAAVLGGVDRYFELVRSKHAFHETFGVAHAGVVEGLARNGGKYAALIAWPAHLAVIPAFVGLLYAVDRLRQTWRLWVLAILAVGPSVYFAVIIFMGNAGLVLPMLPLLYLLAAAGVLRLWPDSRQRWAAAAMAALALLNVVQFTLSPIPRPTNQARVILTVMFTKYTGSGVRALYNYNLSDFEIDQSFRNVLKQLRNPEPVPHIPEDHPEPK